ncbi:putative folate-biopterin transporter 8, chloroplastic [Capsicum galapagoense]
MFSVVSSGNPLFHNVQNSRKMQSLSCCHQQNPSTNVQNFRKKQSFSCCQQHNPCAMMFSVVSSGYPLLVNVQNSRKMQSFSCCKHQNPSTKNTLLPNVQKLRKLRSFSCCKQQNPCTMMFSVVSSGNPLLPNVQKLRKMQSLSCCQHKNPSTMMFSAVSSGYPLLVNVQNSRKMQSFSCCKQQNPTIMMFSVVSSGYPFLPNVQYSRKIQSLSCCKQQTLSIKNTINKPWKPKTHLIEILIPQQVEEVEKVNYPPNKAKKKVLFEEKNGFFSQHMAILCGVGYWVQGFRCFPWLALNFHMANGMNMHPSTLQLVQNFGCLPMVAKPIYGILSDAVYIGGAHRIPYISLGVLLQVLAWGQLALISSASEALPTLMACVLLSNVGASITEVAKDALVAEYGQRNRMQGLQSYAFMASAAGGILGNLIGGYFLLKTQQPKLMFLAFSSLLALQLAVTSATREESLGLAQSSNYSVREPITEIFKKQYSDLMVAVKEESIYRPLIWIVMSILGVPLLSGSIFCYQTQCLNLDPSVIGMSKVIGQLILLSLTVLYDRFGKRVPMRKLIGIVQITYAASLLLDLVLVKQLNLKLGIPNEWFALCFSGVAETIAIFKLLPFHVLFASLAPSGCEGSLMSFLASALCFSSILSGVLGVTLASFLGITSGNYSSLHIGILIQFVAALLPLGWLSYVPLAQPAAEKGRKRGQSKRTRKYRRVGRVVVESFYSYRRKRESDLDENTLLAK